MKTLIKAGLIITCIFFTMGGYGQSKPTKPKEGEKGRIQQHLFPIFQNGQSDSQKKTVNSNQDSTSQKSNQQSQPVKYFVGDYRSQNSKGKKEESVMGED